ncbi:MAG: acyltransferase family protein [Lachnospiraceae bacterium]|nr:acyltransferase family protein [Lachnospiraceae bacterium]
MSYGNQKRKLHIEGLDALRGIAILGVILYHLMPGKVPGGFLGVNLFFVLSGYLIYRTSVLDYHEDRYSVITFYKKRIGRIYPAMLVMVVTVMGVLVLALPQVAKGKLGEVLSIVFGYNNIWQVGQSASYFARISQQSPFTHLWATAVELQFYLVWPVLFGVLRWLCQHTSKRFMRKVLLGIVILTGMWMPVLYQPDQDVSRLYYGTDTRIFALLLGVYVGAIHREAEYISRRRIPAWMHQMALIVVSLLYITAYFVLEGQMPMLYRGGLFVHSILCGILLLLLPYSGWEKALERSPFTMVGKMSYELYLWMYPVIFLFGYNKKNYGIVSWGIQIGLIGILASAQYGITRYVHKRKRYRNKTGISRAACAACSIGIAFMVLTGSVAITQHLPEMKHTSAKLIAKGQYGNHKKNLSAKDMGNKISDKKITEEAVTLTTEAVTEQNADRKTVTAIGDSVLLGADTDIESVIPNCVVDAKESRQVAKARTVVDSLKQKGELGDIVILALGTNGTFSPTVGKKLVKAIGSKRQIYWVTVYGRHLQWQEDSNQMILSMAEKYDNIHVIDWAAYCAGHDDWFLEDGVHLTQDGCKAYAQMLYDSILPDIGTKAEAESVQ